MSFESLAFRYSFEIDGFPSRWIPLIHLYDPDLPMFPIYYFHALSDQNSSRPLDTDRAFGYVEHINLIGTDKIEVTLVLNKDLSIASNTHFIEIVIAEIKERFGLGNPVLLSDVENAFETPLDYANPVLIEMWQRSVSNHYGNMLPFGRLWDEVLGLARFVASWNSQSGRKGELIQTHYFASKYGVKIQSSGGVPQLDFYLLPTISELTNHRNPLTSFPNFASLLEIADSFHKNNCSTLNVDGLDISKFERTFKGQLDTAKIMGILNSSNISQHLRPLAVECFNTFGKGPQRTVIFLMLLDDLRCGRVDPSSLTSSQCGSIYDGLAGTYQSPKVIEIYAQQSFGNVSAMPIDTWIETFFKWPLMTYPRKKTKNMFNYIFSKSNKLGKVERLLWVVGQARKVHSSACNDALWCIKYSSSGQPRGANPLACNICLNSIRECCPAYNEIKGNMISFNNSVSSHDYVITTSSENNTDANQKFISCRGKSIYTEILDDFSPADNPEGFASYPDTNHKGSPLSVEDFVRLY